MQLSHYFLCNAGRVDGVFTVIVLSKFSQILAFGSWRKTSGLIQKCKIMYKNIVLLFYKQKQTIIEIHFGRKMHLIWGKKTCSGGLPNTNFFFS